MTNSNEQLAVIIVAAGSSMRMNGIDKLWEPLCGVPVLEHAVRSAAVHAFELILVVRPEGEERAIALLDMYPVPPNKRVVAGGRRRQDSVRNGLETVTSAWVAVHDGARPLATAALFAKVWDSARSLDPPGAAIPVVDVSDTLKFVRDGLVTDTLSRAEIRSVQTPQVFRTTLLRQAYSLLPLDQDVTDDASVVESSGCSVATCSGERANLKLTQPEDLQIAEAMLSRLQHGSTS